MCHDGSRVVRLCALYYVPHAHRCSQARDRCSDIWQVGIQTCRRSPRGESSPPPNRALSSYTEHHLAGPGLVLRTTPILVCGQRSSQ